MEWFERIKYYYKEGLWDKQRVRDVVGKVITEEQAAEIRAVKAALNQG